MIMNITGGADLTLNEVTAAADLIRRVAATECDLVFGAVVHENFEEGIKITVIAADFQGSIDEELERKNRPQHRKRITMDKDLDIPAFLRREKEVPNTEEKSD